MLNKNGYPPEPSTEAYDEIMKQVENFKKFDDVNYDDSEEYDESFDDVSSGEFNNESNITNGFNKDENTHVSESDSLKYSIDYNDSKAEDLPKVAETSTEFNSFESNVGRFKTNSGRYIYYYGEEFGDSIKSINNSEFANIKTLNDLFAILLKSWRRETAYPSCQRDPQYNRQALLMQSFPLHSGLRRWRQYISCTPGWFPSAFSQTPPHIPISSSPH